MNANDMGRGLYGHTRAAAADARLALSKLSAIAQGAKEGSPAWNLGMAGAHLSQAWRNTLVGSPEEQSVEQEMIDIVADLRMVLGIRGESIRLYSMDDLQSLPIGSTVIDADGDTWGLMQGSGWECMTVPGVGGENGLGGREDIVNYVPLTLLSVPLPGEVSEASLRREDRLAELKEQYFAIVAESEQINVNDRGAVARLDEASATLGGDVMYTLWGDKWRDREASRQTPVSRPDSLAN